MWQSPSGFSDFDRHVGSCSRRWCCLKSENQSRAPIVILGARNDNLRSKEAWEMGLCVINVFLKHMPAYTQLVPRHWRINCGVIRAIHASTGLFVLERKGESWALRARYAMTAIKLPTEGNRSLTKQRDGTDSQAGHLSKREKKEVLVYIRIIK